MGPVTRVTRVSGNECVLAYSTVLHNVCPHGNVGLTLKRFRSNSLAHSVSRGKGDQGTSCGACYLPIQAARPLESRRFPCWPRVLLPPAAGGAGVDAGGIPDLPSHILT